MRPPQPLVIPFPRFGLALAWLLAIVLAPRMATAAEESNSGEQIYLRQCASCHGAKGEGTPQDYPHPLVGDRTLPRLASYIAKSMPEDDPGSCVGEDAEKVAAYIHEAFYSKTAQARAKPPRIELAHLTVRQYRNAVADLLGGFREPGQWGGDRRGLQGDYFKSKQIHNDGVISRVDPVVRFQFAKSSPDPEKIDPKEFSIRWQGSVLAPETGEYEFIVKTENSFRLWVNDLKQQPLIDAYVKSGSDTEYRGSIRLLAGRAYPLRLEYFKAATQGVKKDDKKAEEKPASIALEWALPHRVAEVIPEHNLSPSVLPESFVLASPFPPDDRSVGYERGSSVSKEWEQATTDAAIEVADYVVARLRALTGVRENDPDREPRLRAFCLRFTERAFRRPLTDDQRELYVERQFKDVRDFDTAVKRVVLLTLKSPRFLYREVGGEGDAYDAASRIAFGLWDSLPDKPLLQAAADGQLKTADQVARQAERMVADPRCRAKLRDFFFQWLKVEQIPDLAKDPKQFAEFDQAMASDLRTSLDLLLEDLVWSESSDFRQLLLTDSLYLNGRLAQFYGADLPTDAPFQKVTPEPRERAGVLTHPYLMTSFAYTATSSPIHRGVFLARSVLGLSLRPPPEAFPPLSPDLHPQLSTRERVALQTSPESCQACHAMINPLGFTLEPFDAVGRFRREENGRSIDATGAYQTRTGELVKFAGARDLATFLASSPETHNAFIEQLFHHIVKQPVRAFGSHELEDLRTSFAEGNFNIRKLVVKVVADTALTPRHTKP
ncbi:DUF1592 domain-containing protein [Singulisphaera acidiphila]|uniref:Cytochrome c n=1 Tax=Singulisphaera acidiphila (strain ATCC BAA-1392 / DSM 18658 / VKM B-2454 / MOB10) TaxID=886293 RepID=L0D7X1_SINAD|nr:DUF1592 domain-containing protein [Singulisphaera acidiphila]AGA25342.1 cytochrome c [Singulisphaera acidiphila DSM 18658]